MTKSSFRISLLSLLLIPAAFAVGWWIGMRTMNDRLIQIEQDFERRNKESETVSHALNGAIFINLAYRKLASTSLESQEQSRTSLLLNELISLARAEPFKKDNQARAFLRSSNEALQLLGVNTLDELKLAVKNSDLIENFQALFLNPRNPEYQQVTDFIKRALEYGRAQPQFPGSVWLRAIHEKDAELLKSAFSQRINSQTVDWSNQLETYRAKLTKELGETEPLAFTFGASTSMDLDGELELYWQDQEYRRFKIVHEKTGWRLDEF